MSKNLIHHTWKPVDQLLQDVEKGSSYPEINSANSCDIIELFNALIR